MSILWCILGVLTGVLFGVIPGAGPFLAIATLYPLLPLLNEGIINCDNLTMSSAS